MFLWEKQKQKNYQYLVEKRPSAMENRLILHRYYVAERTIVKNVTPKNMIIDRGQFEVDNQIPKAVSFHYCLLRNVKFILLYQILVRN